MARTTTVRKYGRSTRKQTAEILFAQLPKSPVKSDRGPEPEPGLGPGPTPETQPAPETGPHVGDAPVDDVSELAQQLCSTRLEDTARAEGHGTRTRPRRSELQAELEREAAQDDSAAVGEVPQHARDGREEPETEAGAEAGETEETETEVEESVYGGLRVITWADVCPPGARIEKIAEASYAEVYRVTNEHGTSIIKVVRLESPIKPQTKAQERSGLVDEEPHSEEDMQGELRISEWLAGIPGFVVYKEQYVVKGKAPKVLLETHQAFHRRMKRKDPDRLQFYPSPSRYLDDTRFLVVELGDAGTALEDFELTSISQVWDIFFHTALALARAEDLIEFEHRDLHEGNLCIRRVRPPTTLPESSSSATTTTTTTTETTYKFGHSGLDITILDYGLSRATNPNPPSPSSPSSSSSQPPPPPAAAAAAAEASVVAYDLEKDLSLFQSTHAPQCQVYRQMRSYLIHGDRVARPSPRDHATPYPPAPGSGSGSGSGGPISWRGYHPYTNVLWLAYLYAYLVRHFAGDARELKRFRRETRELWAHLDPGAPRDVLSFPSAGEVVRFAVEAGWIAEAQVVDGEASFVSVAGGR
ncbi:hypothetical protein L209DRAFT_705309 [Thermothelomyces heterothallicus CBS 203.75]